MKNIKAYIALFLAFSLLLVITHYDNERYVNAKVVKIVSHSSWWNCGDDGYTVIELNNHVRKTICGEYGFIGETITIDSNIIN